MTLLDKKTTIDTVRLAIFMVVTTLATALLAVTIGNVNFDAATEYKAVFTDVDRAEQGRRRPHRRRAGRPGRGDRAS